MNGSNSAIRVLVVDDHPVVRRGIAAWLGRHEQIKLVGEAGDGREALEKARALFPDVVITDVEMPEMDGADLTLALGRELPSVRVLVFSIYHTPGLLLRMAKAGAVAYIFKESPTKELIHCIEQIGRERIRGHKPGTNCL